MVFSWSMAEELALAHMHQIGFVDARRSKAGADGGVDVASMNAVAQVKHLSVPVGSPEVQRLRGAAHGIRNALFYSSSGYSAAALRVADVTGVALFDFDTSNSVIARNHVAQQLVSSAASPTSFELIAARTAAARDKRDEAVVLTSLLGSWFKSAAASRLTAALQRDLEDVGPFVESFLALEERFLGTMKELVAAMESAEFDQAEGLTLRVEECAEEMESVVGAFVLDHNLAERMNPTT